MRRHRTRVATPVWCDKEKIYTLYLKAKVLGMEIDHIIPIKHELVCGLHVPDNLQLLPRFDNRSKKNKFNPEDVIGLVSGV